ncbi:MAG: type II toxin-antitoxin system HicA family toxin [Firmicutes bacterium]|nr:type II toxin-antitoxin system HicA family toxin [Bacillota bacterium]
MTFRELEKIVTADGWVRKSSVGSHIHYKHPTKPGKVTILIQIKPCKKWLVKKVILQRFALAYNNNIVIYQVVQAVALQ